MADSGPAPKDYPNILRAFSDLLLEHGHDAEAGTLRAIADGVAGLVRGPTLVWPEDGPTGGPFVVDSFHLGRDQLDVSSLADGMRVIHMGDTLRITARRRPSTGTRDEAVRDSEAMNAARCMDITRDEHDRLMISGTRVNYPLS